MSVGTILGIIECRMQEVIRHLRAALSTMQPTIAAQLKPLKNLEHGRYPPLNLETGGEEFRCDIGGTLIRQTLVERQHAYRLIGTVYSEDDEALTLIARADLSAPQQRDLERKTTSLVKRYQELARELADAHIEFLKKLGSSE